MRVQELRGHRVLDALGPALDDLHRVTNTPITARRPWLKVWAEFFPEYEPWAIVVESQNGLQAAALLGRRRRPGFVDVVGLGHGPSDHLRLPARNAESARVLATQLAAQLHAIRGPWRARLLALPELDPVGAEAVTRLRCATLSSGPLSPCVEFHSDRRVEACGHPCSLTCSTREDHAP